MKTRARRQWMMRHIEDEVNRATGLFPSNDKLHIAMCEEVGEMSQALLDCHRRGKCTDEEDDVFHKDFYTEAVQAAAMIIRLVTEGDPDFKYDPEVAFRGL